MEERERELKNIFSVRQLGESRIRMVSAHTSHMQWPQALVCVCEEPPAHSTSRQGRPVAGAHTHTLTKCLETWRPDVPTSRQPAHGELTCAHRLPAAIHTQHLQIGFAHGQPISHCRTVPLRRPAGPPLHKSSSRWLSSLGLPT